jgi:hypothetical protein
MAALILITAVVVHIAVAGLGALVMIVLGIRRVDRPERQRLTDAARTPVDAATRRVLGLGARTSAHSREEEQITQC